MAYNFTRGRQMIVHDPRLNNPLTNPPTPLRPPAAMNVWTVSANHTAEHIVGWAATVAKGPSGTEQLDALHFMAHGMPGGMQIGSNNFGWGNVKIFEKLAGSVKGAIIFFGCQVGGEQSSRGLSYGVTFGNAVSQLARCKVITCKMNQMYSWQRGQSVIDFGEFEDVVYLYTPGAGPQMLNANGKTKVNLEPVVFG